MTNAKRAETTRELAYQLERYRHARREAALHSLRNEPVPQQVRISVGFHAQGVAECLDRLGGRTT